MFNILKNVRNNLPLFFSTTSHNQPADTSLGNHHITPCDPEKFSSLVILGHFCDSPRSKQIVSNP